MTNIALNDAQIQAIFAKALMDSMTPEAKEKLIVDAVQNLLIQKTSSNYNAPTILQDAFNRAVVEIAQKQVRDIVLADTRIGAKVNLLIEEAATKALAEEQWGSIVETLSSAIRKAITGDRN